MLIVDTRKCICQHGRVGEEVMQHLDRHETLRCDHKLGW